MAGGQTVNPDEAQTAPSKPSERRKLQNRTAQRKFRIRKAQDKNTRVQGTSKTSPPTNLTDHVGGGSGPVARGPQDPHLPENQFTSSLQQPMSPSGPLLSTECISSYEGYGMSDIQAGLSENPSWGQLNGDFSSLEHLEQEFYSPSMSTLPCQASHFPPVHTNSQPFIASPDFTRASEILPSLEASFSPAARETTNTVPASNGTISSFPIISHSDEPEVAKVVSRRSKSRSRSNSTVEQKATPSHGSSTGQCARSRSDRDELWQFKTESNEKWKPLLHISAHNGYEMITRMLLERGVDINEKDSAGRTALHLAIRQRHDQVLRLLLERGADINACDKSGWTPLHQAVENGFESGLQLLLMYGANPNAKGREQ
ncbi:MAG: hypothetical protein M1837_007510 [Sclerophora amabilis]|nr:MAG: hypothetical protein M1837_007510 [Sclerophora amabilis]